MNRTIISGRATKDPELKYTQGAGKAVATFGLAVQDRYNKEKTDFLNIVAWGNQAEYAATKLGKGKRVLIEGRISTRSYDGKDGKKVYITEIIAENLEIIDWMDDDEQRGTTAGGAGLEDMTPVDDGDIPF